MRSADRQELPGTDILRIARTAVEYGCVHGEPPPIRLADLPPVLADPGATFTTLRFDGALRGCCGTLEAADSLGRNVARSAFQAAFRDPRFDPVSADELGGVRLEVAVLSPLESLFVADEAELLACLTPGTDGLVVIADGRRATFLPKVWESLPDPREFVAALKAKCGLTDDDRPDRLRFQRYRTTSFAESV